MACKEIIIDGIKYVPEAERDLGDGKKVIVRTRSAGVHYGTLVLRDDKNKVVTLANARRIWAWYGAASLSELAIRGVSKPKECKIPCPVPGIVLSEWIEIIPCTVTAQKSIEGVSEWTAH